MDHLERYVHPDFKSSEKPSTYIQNLKQKQSSKKLRRKKTVERLKLKTDYHLHNVNIKWNEALLLNEKWMSYVSKLLDVDSQGFTSISETNQERLKSIFFRIDLHGAELIIVKAKNPTLVNVTGIVLLESKNTFQLLKRDCTVKVIPKIHTVIEVKFGCYKLRFYGEQLNMKPCDRFSKKIKKIAPLTDLEALI